MKLSIYTQTYTLEKVGSNIETNSIEKNWEGVKTEILSLTDYRINSSRHEWYRCAYEECAMDVHCFVPTNSKDINYLPQGILAEVFFLNACRQNGIDCNPSCGDEDVMGADFYLTYGKETRFFDVTTNTFARSVSRKVKEGTFPSLFIPWAYKDNGKPSYAEDYLREGKFNGQQFLHSVLDVNYDMLDCLKRKVWRNQDVDRKLFRDEVLDLSKCGIQYVNHLDGLLYLIRRAM